jgi:hypothetical protein
MSLLLYVLVYLCRHRNLGVGEAQAATQCPSSTREETACEKNTGRSASPCRSTGLVHPWLDVWHQISINTQVAQ